MRIYGKGSIPEFKDQIVANIWSADKFWEIKWFEDGVEKGRMERINAMDPLAVKLYQGGDKPEKHKWVEPYNTDHLFIAKPSPDAEKIRVTAKDRWGNIYSEEMILG